MRIYLKVDDFLFLDEVHAMKPCRNTKLTKIYRDFLSGFLSEVEMSLGGFDAWTSFCNRSLRPEEGCIFSFLGRQKRGRERDT